MKIDIFNRLTNTEKIEYFYEMTFPVQLDPTDAVTLIFSDTSVEISGKKLADIYSVKEALILEGYILGRIKTKKLPNKTSYKYDILAIDEPICLN